MQLTRYDECRAHLAALQGTVGQLRLALDAYATQDHHSSLYDSPFMLELDEELIALNIQVEKMIRRLDPFYQGEYLAGEEGESGGS
jgi:hypothetical protein